jgi:Flp pilus assembly pilin Flp
MKRFLRRLLHDISDEGQGLVEYGLLLALVFILSFIGLMSYTDSASGMINRVGASVSTIS